MGSVVPGRLAIWDPDRLDDTRGRLLRRALADPAFSYDAVQFRLSRKRSQVDELKELAGLVAPRPLWVNRDRELASALDATGLQVGADMPPREITEIQRQGFAVGISVHHIQEIQRLAPYRPAFFLFGHVFPSRSKPGLPPRGLDALTEAVEASDVPVLAIGGITPAREAEVLATGAAGIAAIGAAFSSG